MGKRFERDVDPDPPTEAELEAEAQEAVADLSPSSKFVLRVLIEEGPLTQAEVTAETAMPQRTVRYALERLVEVDAVTKRKSLQDARQKIYEAEIDFPRGGGRG